MSASLQPGSDDVLSRLLNLDEVQAAALKKLPRSARDYYRSGARDELSLRANRAALDDIFLRPRVLVDVAERHMQAQLLDHRLRMPIAVAPTAFQGMAWPDGELATARACARAGTVMTLSTLSTRPVEDVVAAWREAGGGPEGGIWFQLYVYKDRSVTRDLVQRAAAAGCRALVVTVDAPVLGTRERDVRNGFRLPDDLHIEDLLDAAGLEGERVRQGTPDGSQLAEFVYRILDPSLSWEDMTWLREVSGLPVLVKGVLRGDDANRAIQAGCDGVIVSNHGGRQLDGALPTIRALPQVVQAVDGRGLVLLDGGIRRGVHALKAMALGADAVLVGRPPLWGLSVAGEAGVAHVLDILRQELDEAMALCGCPDLGAITADLVASG